ncbi:hypothetical protein C3478_01910 [Mycobacterium kansasii]|nr:hypothetical protein C3478_01910 [Mycobacterium kansasii]
MTQGMLAGLGGRLLVWQFKLGLLAIIWGCSFLFIKVALADLSPAEITLGRCLLGALAVAPGVAVRRLALPHTQRLWMHLFVAALFLNTAPFLLYGYAERHVSSAVAGVANGTSALFTVLFAFTVLHDERATVHTVLGILIGLTGVAVVLRVWDGVHADTGGVLVAVAAAACQGFGWVYVRHFLRHTGYSPLVLTAGQLSLASAQLILLCLATAPRIPTMGTTTLAAVLALGVLGTGLAYVLQHSIIRDAGATAASTVTYLIPVVAVTVGAIFLHEPVGWSLLGGAALVLLGAALTQRRRPAG